MSYNSEVMADIPLCYWKLEEASGNFADSSGNGFTAIPFGDPYNYQQPPGITTGFSISNATFGASGSRAAVSTDVTLSDANIWTLEAWIKTVGSADPWGIIEMGLNSPEMRITDTGMISLVKSFGAADGDSTVTVNDNQWHHCVGRRTGGASTIWIDGVDRTGTMANPSYANSNNPTGFGALWDGTSFSPAGPFGNSTFVGNLDEIAIYDHALSDARIIAHYQAGLGASEAPQVLSMQSHVFGHNMW